MLYKNIFHVEGGLYTSEQSLFYGSRRVCVVVTELGNRTDYNTRRRELYRFRDKLLKWQNELSMAGFEIVPEGADPSFSDPAQLNLFGNEK